MSVDDRATTRTRWTAATPAAAPPKPHAPTGVRDLPDEVLVARAADGDPHAFELLIRRYQRQMFAVALRIVGRRDDAEDATQNAFIAVWRRLPEFHGQAKFSTWLYRTVTNHALNVVRGRARSDRQVNLDSLSPTQVPVTASALPAPLAETAELVHQVNIALQRLTPDLRVCWLAREVDHCSYQEVADIAGVSLDTARGRILRARRQLSAALEAWR